MGVSNKKRFCWYLFWLFVLCLLLCWKLANNSKLLLKHCMSFQSLFVCFIHWQADSYDLFHQICRPKHHTFLINVLTWNRPQSLHRLLQSLKNASYDGDILDLHIHIDGGARHKIVNLTYKVVNDFYWPYGTKKVLFWGKTEGSKCLAPDLLIFLEDFYSRFHRKMKMLDWQCLGSRHGIQMMKMILELSLRMMLLCLMCGTYGSERHGKCVNDDICCSHQNS